LPLFYDIFPKKSRSFLGIDLYKGQSIHDFKKWYMV